MSGEPAREPVDALHQRLREVAGVLLDPVPETSPVPAEACGELLMALTERVRDDLDPARVWLLLTALAAAFPVDADVRAARRRLELSSVDDACIWLLEWAHDAARGRGRGTERLRLVRDAVVVDVDFTAKNDLQTGVQRVVRRLLPRWVDSHPLQLAVWSEGTGAFREPTDDECERVLRWSGPLHRASPAPALDVLLVPWQSTVVLPEVPGGEQCSRLAGLAQHSGNRVVLVGHDCIPVLSTDLMPDSEPVKFVRYLTLVKHASVVAGVSASAATEFRGFSATLPNQGLVGPQVVACPLASDAALAVPGPRPHTDEPEVVVVGSHEPRKNHLAVLHAAEVLWRQGLRFRLRFLGAGGWTTEAFDRQLARLTEAGRTVTAERGLDDEQLWTAFRRARFTVFPSLHEGFGLPVVESLSFGTPVIGTSYGSIAELAADGGVVLVDPRDDDQLTAAMHRLLTDDDELARLRDAARRRPARTWEHYADELWGHLVQAR